MDPHKKALALVKYCCYFTVLLTAYIPSLCR